MDKNNVLITGSIVFREDRGKDKYLIVKEASDSYWEFPKVVTRKGESSVRASLRIMGEKGGMTTRVLEEAGRVSAATTSGGKTIQQKFIYYLMILKSKSLEAIGYSDFLWLDYAGCAKKLSKKEANMLKEAKEILRDLKKSKKLHKGDEEEEEAVEMGV